MNHNIRMLVLLAIDALLVNLALFLALLLRFEGKVPQQYLQAFWQFSPEFTIILCICFFIFGLYRRAWQYASVGELIAVAVAVSTGSVFQMLYAFFVNGQQFPLPRSVFLLNWILIIYFIGASRLAWRLVRDYEFKAGEAGRPAPRNVLVVGAGDAGVMVVKELKGHYNGSIRIVGFIDDDTNKQRMIVQGTPVLGTREDISSVVKSKMVQEIVIAIPSAEGRVIREIVGLCRKTKVKVRILPGMYDILDGRVKVTKIRDVQVEDLLGREPVRLNMSNIIQFLKGQVVLITGGAGSIGSELCRQVAGYAPKMLLVLDNCENSVYDIELELREKYPALPIVPLVKDIRDKTALDSVFRAFRPQVVLHAAAHKHVPLMERNPEEAIKNNVMGTFYVAQAAGRFGAKKMVLISTDKAVNPTSVMGASKRMAEMVVQYMNSVSPTSYAAVRFGNVLGSRGSVVPLFKKQIADGGPVTVTHREMVRYFMTIPEAVQLVLQTGAMAKGGEIFVLDMGDPVRIIDLAESLIRLSGFEPGRDIEIKETGIRPGEKLYEELLTAEEGIMATAHKRIFAARPHEIQTVMIEEKIIRRVYNGFLPQNEHEAVEMIREFLPEFRQGYDKEAQNASA